jgi:drug/metabolite transporter (DMT)-like permease
VTAVAGAFTGVLLGMTEEWKPAFVVPSLYLILAGILVTLGNLSIVIAYRDAEVSVVAPFRYFSILTALLLGYLIFASLPDRISTMGILLIIASGVYTMHRERVRRREAAAAAAPLGAQAGSKETSAAWTTR